MNHSVFVDEEDIPMVHQDDDGYDDYNTPNTRRMDEAETSFMVPDTTEATSTLRLGQKVKRYKIKALYRHLNVTGDIDLIDLDQFRLTTDPKKGVTIFEFFNDNRWVPLTKQLGKFFAPKTLKDMLGELNTMKNFLDIDKTLPALERSFKAATKLKGELPTNLQMGSIPLEDLSSLAKDIHVKTRETSRNTDLDMQEFLGINKAY